MDKISQKIIAHLTILPTLSQTATEACRQAIQTEMDSSKDTLDCARMRQILALMDMLPEIEVMGLDTIGPNRQRIKACLQAHYCHDLPWSEALTQDHTQPVPNDHQRQAMYHKLDMYIERIQTEIEELDHDMQSVRAVSWGNVKTQNPEDMGHRTIRLSAKKDELLTNLETYEYQKQTLIKLADICRTCDTEQAILAACKAL